MASRKFRIKTDDEVIVLAGKDRGKTGRVLRVLRGGGLVLVEGVRRVKRHQRASGDRAGGIVEKEAPLAISNVAIWNRVEDRRVKVGFTIVDGKKRRVDRATGAVLDA